MESLQSLEDMRLEFERLEAEESEIDLELGELIKQQPNLLIKGKNYMDCVQGFSIFLDSIKNTNQFEIS